MLMILPVHLTLWLPPFVCNKFRWQNTLLIFTQPSFGIVCDQFILGTVTTADTFRSTYVYMVGSLPYFGGLVQIKS